VNPIRLNSHFAVDMKLLLLSLGLFAAVFAATHVLKFPGSVAHFIEVTGGQSILDLSPSFSSDEVYRRLDAMGEAGRSAYLRLIWTVDVLFPLVALYFLLTLARVAERTAAPGRPLGTLLFALPLVYFSFDLLENVSVLALIVYFPAQLPMVGSTLGVLTVIKRTSMMLALTVPLLLVAWTRIRAAGSTSRPRQRTVASPLSE
jgi:hypothetical protein